MDIGSKLFQFKLADTTGEIYNKYTFADRSALLIVFTCNHCPYARAYWTRFKKLHEKYEYDNLGILAINPNCEERYPADSPSEMKKLVKSLKIPFPYLHDPSQKTAHKFGVERTPEVFLFNSKRELVYKGAIDDNWENEHMVTQVYLEDAIEYALDGMEVDYPHIPAVGCSIKWKVGNEPGD